jgi:hypothetical protein
MTDSDGDALRLSAACRLLDFAVGKAGRAEDSSIENQNNEVNEILTQMRERARRMRPRDGGSSGGVSA